MRSITVNWISNQVFCLSPVKLLSAKIRNTKGAKNAFALSVELTMDDTVNGGLTQF